MRTFLLPLLVSLGLALPAVAREIRLDDGTVVYGEILTRSDSTVTVLNPALGKISLPASRIVSGLEASSTSVSAEKPEQDTTPSRRLPSRDTDPAGYALFMLPTAFMPPAKSFTFRDFELFFLTFGYSPTSTTAITTGTFFPITGSFGIFTLGGKQQLFNVDGTAAAVTASLIMPLEGDGESLFNSNVVVSHRVAMNGYADAFGLHGTLGFLTGSGGSIFVYGMGSELRLGAHAKFIAEYLSTEESDGNGLLNIGIRLQGERLSADIAGMRVLGVDGGDMQFWPLVVVNYRF